MNIYGTHDTDTIQQLRGVARDAQHVALMADGHIGYVMPIGGVAAYRNKVSPIGVGVDIGCGNAALRLDMGADLFDNERYCEDFADWLYDTIGFGPGRSNQAPDAPEDHPLFEDDRWNLLPSSLRDQLRGRARDQLGTIGGGNHFVDVFTCNEGTVWVGCHFGSRALGYIIAHGMVARAQGLPWNDMRPRPNMNEQVLLDLDTQLGQDYWDLMELAGEYAYVGRHWVVHKVARMLCASPLLVGSGDILQYVHNHHNFAWRETHHGEDLIVVRKGATPAGKRGFIGANMADPSVILGAQPYDSATLASTVHGAGRVMGRNEARGKWKKGECVRPGRVSPGDMIDRISHVTLRGGDLDEAPQTYRPLHEVLDSMGHRKYIENMLYPRIVCMAPSRTGAFL